MAFNNELYVDVRYICYVYVIYINLHIQNQASTSSVFSVMIVTTIVLPVIVEKSFYTATDNNSIAYTIIPMDISEKNEVFLRFK